MKVLVASLLVLLSLLQYRLWVGAGSLAEVSQLKHAIKTQEQENKTLDERNRALDAEVKDLKQGLAAIEERARSELGMIRKGETFFQFVEE